MVATGQGRSKPQVRSAAFASYAHVQPIEGREGLQALTPPSQLVLKLALID